MRPARFSYHAPESLEAALGVLAEAGDEAVPLAGGQSLLPMLNLRLARPTDVIDLSGAREELSVVSSEDDSTRVGALVTHHQMHTSAHVAQHLPLAQHAAGFVGYRAIRNRGTVGGSVAHADPAAEWPAVLLALDGTVELQSKTATRQVAGADFFQSFLQTAKQPDELVTAVLFSNRFNRHWGFCEFQRRTGDFAVVAAAVACVTDEAANSTNVTEARVALAGVGPTPIRSQAAEAALVATGDPVAAAEAARDDVEPTGDLHGSANYRRQLVYAQVRRACVDALASPATGPANGPTR